MSEDAVMVYVPPLWGSLQSAEETLPVISATTSGQLFWKTTPMSHLACIHDGEPGQAAAEARRVEERVNFMLTEEFKNS